MCSRVCTSLGDFVTLRLIRGCALGPLKTSALGGKTPSPYGEVTYGKAYTSVKLCITVGPGLSKS